jgi:putative ABC transport system substrate-binding protein
MSKFFKTIIMGLVLILSVACAKEENRLYTIGIVQITQDPLLDEARKGVIDSLEEEGFIEGKNIRIDYKNAQGEMSNIILILRKFISDKVDMVITNSTPCMVAAAKTITGIPVVFTVAFSPEQIKMKKVPQNLTGVFDPLYMDDFVKLMKTVIPGLKVVGLPYNPAESNACLAAENLGHECKKQGIELVEMPAYASSEVLQTAQVLANKRVDAFAVSADNTIYIAFGSVVKIAEERHIPLFVTEPNQVKRGACAGIGPDFYHWGKESGKVASLIIKGKRADQIPIRPIKSKVIYVNLKSAKAQGISFPLDLLKEADKVIR